MISFLSFIKETYELKTKYSIDPKTKQVVIGHVHFRYGHESYIKEDSFDPIAFSKKVYQEREHHDSLSATLHARQVKPTADEKKHLKLYTKGTKVVGSNNVSTTMNRKLINNHISGAEPTTEMTDKEKEVHNAIKRLASNPIRTKTNLYSGTDFDPSEAAKNSKDGILHAPAHISATHSLSVAQSFARNKAAFTPRSDGKKHIIKIATELKDKAYHVGKHSSKPDEYETIIPAGTKLKYHHSTVEKDDLTGEDFHVHHFTVHSQD
jgi:hypothetical protein